MTASQSSTKREAERALTAAPATHWPGTCTLTNRDADPWWQVGLSGTWDVTAIRLTSIDASIDDRDHLHHVDVFVGNTKCASDISVGRAATKLIPCVGTGNSIKVQHHQMVNTTEAIMVNTTKSLTLCGFAAMGTKGAPGALKAAVEARAAAAKAKAAAAEAKAAKAKAKAKAAKAKAAAKRAAEPKGKGGDPKGSTGGPTQPPTQPPTQSWHAKTVQKFFNETWQELLPQYQTRMRSEIDRRVKLSMANALFWAVQKAYPVAFKIAKAKAGSVWGSKLSALKRHVKGSLRKELASSILTRQTQKWTSELTLDMHKRLTQICNAKALLRAEEASLQRAATKIEETSSQTISTNRTNSVNPRSPPQSQLLQ